MGLRIWEVGAEEQNAMRKDERLISVTPETGSTVWGSKKSDLGLSVSCCH